MSNDFHETLSVSDFAASCVDMYYSDFINHCNSTCDWVEREMKDKDSYYRTMHPKLSMLKGFIEEALDFVKTDGKCCYKQDHYPYFAQILRGLYKKVGKECPI